MISIIYIYIGIKYFCFASQFYNIYFIHLQFKVSSMMKKKYIFERREMYSSGFKLIFTLLIY